MKSEQPVGAVLVVGSGIGGMQSALDLAESGFKVYLLDSASAIGGTMAALDKTFPTNDCAMCIMAPKLVECGRHLNIEIITLAEVESILGEPGNFEVNVLRHPRYVDIDKCTGCGLCVTNCPVHNSPHFDQKEDGPPELEIEDLKKINLILERYEDKSASTIPILQDVNELFSYLPEDLLRYLAVQLEVPVSQIYNLATFYNAFSLTPRGENIIQVCLGTACHVKGAPRILDALERELSIKSGETSSDGLFTLEAVRCLGCCGLAPVLTVNDEVFGEVTQAKISRILKQFQQKGEVTYA